MARLLETNSESKKEVVNVVLTGDANYVEPIAVVMTSILENLNKGFYARFYLFTDNYPEDKQIIIKKLESKYNCEIIFINVLPHMYLFENSSTDNFKNKYISMACYYRLLLFKLLPEDVGKVFYVDGDMIVDTDLSKLLPLLDEKIAIAVVESFAMENRETVLSHLCRYVEFNNYNNSPNQFPYFNAGFVGLNMDICKKEGIWDKIYALYKKESNFPYADQDILNAIIGQQYRKMVTFLPPEYNVFCARAIDHNKSYLNAYYPPEAVLKAYECPKIYHYAGPEKPWSYPICNYYAKWWQYAIKSPVQDTLLMNVATHWKQEVDIRFNAGNNYIPRGPKASFYRYFNKVKTFFYVRLIKNASVKARFTNYSNSVGPGPINLIKKSIRLLYYNISDEPILSTEEEKNRLNGREIRKLIEKHDIISFDIFDTLICRAFIEPNDLLRYIGAQHAKDNYFDDRIEAANQAMRKSTKEDVNLHEIYDEIQSDLKQMEDAEINAELQYCYTNDLINGIYQYAKNNNKKIIYTSDMYLPKNLILQMLNKCGYDSNNELFLSSDYGKLKWTGSLFDTVITHNNIEPERILHIGDNPLGDYSIPIEKKIKAFKIPTKKQLLFNESPGIEKYCQSHHDLSSSIITGIIAKEVTKNDDYWYKIGIKLAGPIVYSYATWLIHQFRKDGIKNVLFVARDGYLLKKTFDILVPGEFKTHYLYAPRRLSNICNMDFDLKLSYGDWATEFVDSIYQNYLTDVLTEQDWSQLSPKEKNQIVKDNELRIKDISTAKKQQYRNYLQKIGLDKTNALVDTTTTFFSTQKMIKNVLPETNIIGYYWVTAYNNTVDKEIDSNHQRSFVSGHRNHISDWDIMEFIFTSPEHPILDINEEGQPVFKQANENDILRSKVFTKIADGAINYITALHEYYYDPELIQLSGEQLEVYVNLWIDNPSNEDKKHFKEMRLPVRCEHDLYVPVFKPWYS